MRAFVYQANPSRVVFGAGSLQQLPAEVDRLGAQRVLCHTLGGSVNLPHAKVHTVLLQRAFDGAAPQA